MVDAIDNLFHTTHKVKNRGQRCGDIEWTGYLENVTGPVSLVLDLHISHERWRSRSDPSTNDIDRSLNENVVDKIRKNRTD